MSAKSFPTWDKFEARTERYMTNEPGLARPTLCSWHRSLARCLGAGTERSPISKEALRSAFGLPEADAFSFALSFESNQYECGEGFKTVSDYADCLEEVRNCDKSEVDAAVQGCTQGRTTEVRNIKGAQRECSAERIANECLYRFGVMKCGKAVEKYYCKMQEFVSRRRIFEGAAQCPEPFQCEL
uniref:DUF19 domain-containing protein n=1 Tax=Steinernema glaseri TaxID=37863 RepID=A0A1I8AQ52_9BILA